MFDFIQTKYFEFFIMSVILLNMLSMMIQHYNQPKEVELALDYLNYVFTGIFTLEAIIRLTAMRLEYFKYGMNVFDFVIVVFSIAGMYFLLVVAWPYSSPLVFINDETDHHQYRKLQFQFFSRVIKDLKIYLQPERWNRPVRIK